MGQITIGSQPLELPLQFVAPLIETQPTWGAGWQASPELELVTLTVNASSIEPSSCVVTYRYGNSVKQVTDTSFQSYSPLNLIGTWIRVSFAGQQGTTVQFVGQIESAGVNLWGSNSNPAGQQTWTAVDGLRLLQKIVVSEAVFYDSDQDETSTVGWVPAMNKRDHRGLIVGNVSDADDDGNYYYGGDSPATTDSDKWTHSQYINYLINNFIQRTDGDSGDTTGPTWSLGGQTDITDNLQTTVNFSQASSVAEMLKLLITPKYGIDWNVVYTAGSGAGSEGFQINIFALTNKEATFGSATMPSNPNTVSINRTNQIDLIKSDIVSTEQRRVDEVKVIGKRIVVCGTLWGSNAIGCPGDGQDLINKWSSSLETNYINADGIAQVTPLNVQNCDTARRREKYRDVYQHLGAPDDWDLDGGSWSVSCKKDGSLTTDDYQGLVRETLDWIPLKTGFDYTTNPATDNTDGSTEPETQAPLAWLYDAHSKVLEKPGYVQCDLNGIHVGRPHLDWGVFLQATPNHLLADNQWTQTQQTTTGELNVFLYDYTTAVATIAIESDHRLSISYQVPDELAAGDGSVMTVHDEEAELWVALPDTVVDCDTDGTFKFIAGSSDGGPLILRNDLDRLSLIMAGIVSRYINQRSRAKLLIKGFQPWASMVGSILSVYQQGDEVQQIGSIISSIVWSMGDAQTGPTMTVNAGYA